MGPEISTSEFFEIVRPLVRNGQSAQVRVGLSAHDGDREIVLRFSRGALVGVDSPGLTVGVALRVLRASERFGMDYEGCEPTDEVPLMAPDSLAAWLVTGGAFLPEVLPEVVVGVAQAGRAGGGQERFVGSVRGGGGARKGDRRRVLVVVVVLGVALIAAIVLGVIL